MSSITLARSRPRLSLGQVASHVRRIVLAFELALQVRRERRMLLSMDDRALEDVGFKRGDACAEAQRSFWDLPLDRLRI